ncbi:hypothetical protein [Leisingera methylohalidivorans]|uniref:C2H2-type domain-containing protein n=1 Tax=Leisingera methylohalidivorans DSM 14336 TaxID=999552 RepID=V9VZC4_9RHOB|nr:hypothetical protein [Leisingera methylohalidivorans]AHD03268.1 hypothetical protein METH_17990 [Leisingera methylohalidivorans DSM 14336]
MNILDHIKAARAPGNGAKGSAGKGVFFCSRCGKRSHKEASIQQHIRDLHGGDGNAMKEPPRRQMMRALIAAQELAAGLEASREVHCLLAEWFLHRDGATAGECKRVFADLRRARLACDKASPHSGRPANDRQAHAFRRADGQGDPARN